LNLNLQIRKAGQRFIFFKSGKHTYIFNSLWFMPGNYSTAGHTGIHYQDNDELPG
jgi:hypothetical protein